MDITKHQIKNGSIRDLMCFRNEIARYLESKKYSTKSITLLTTMKNINNELSKREIIEKKRRSLPKRLNMDRDDQPILLMKIPDFLQDSLLNIKRLRTDDLTFISNFNNAFGELLMSDDSEQDSHLISAFFIKNMDSDESDSSSIQGTCATSYLTSDLELKGDQADLFFY